MDEKNNIDNLNLSQSKIIIKKKENKLVDKAVQVNIKKDLKDMIIEIFDENKNLSFGLTFFGRLVMTYYSFHGLFFIYNLIIQYIILMPGLLYDIETGVGKFFFLLPIFVSQ